MSAPILIGLLYFTAEIAVLVLIVLLFALWRLSKPSETSVPAQDRSE